MTVGGAGDEIRSLNLWPVEVLEWLSSIVEDGPTQR